MADSCQCQAWISNGNAPRTNTPIVIAEGDGSISLCIDCLTAYVATASKGIVFKETGEC